MSKKVKKNKKKPRSILYGLKRNINTKYTKKSNVPKVRKDLIDADYLDQLSEDEYLWYAQFTNEWAGAAISKTKGGNVKRGHIHTTNQQAKELYDANNRRNNDIHGVTSANNLLTELQTRVGSEDDENELRQVSNVNLTEQATIATIEREEVESKEILTKREYVSLRKSGAKIPQDMVQFYNKYYKLEL
jgi:hypothetical protein